MPVGVVMDKVMDRIMSRTCQSYDPVERDSEKRERSKWDQWNRLVDAIGRRYEECRISNLAAIGDQAASQRQHEAIEKLKALCDHMREHVRSGGNVILYGPPGTGKDHLLVALLRVAIGEEFTVRWTNGQDLFGAFRDRIDTNLSEESAISNFCAPDILAISDPVPPKGSASDFSTTMLYRVIDGRYRRMRSTWITANVAKADEARDELSGPIFDRLIDNCVAVFCNWPSYRQQRKPEWLK